MCFWCICIYIYISRCVPALYIYIYRCIPNGKRNITTWFIDSIAKWLAKSLEAGPAHDTWWSHIRPSIPSGASSQPETYPMSTRRWGTVSCIRAMPWPQRFPGPLAKACAQNACRGSNCDLPNLRPINIFHEPLQNSSKLVILIFTKFTVFSRSSLTFSRSIHVFSRLRFWMKVASTVNQSKQYESAHCISLVFKSLNWHDQATVQTPS